MQHLAILCFHMHMVAVESAVSLDCSSGMCESLGSDISHIIIHDHLRACVCLMSLCVSVCVFIGDGSHIMTGPIYVCGAEPGDVLQVDILELLPRKHPQTGKVRHILAKHSVVFKSHTLKRWDADAHM